MLPISHSHPRVPPIAPTETEEGSVEYVSAAIKRGRNTPTRRRPSGSQTVTKWPALLTSKAANPATDDCVRCTGKIA